MATHKLPNKQMQHGFSMLEILVSVVVISIGLLGLAGLQATSLKANAGAYERTQASILAQDILDRMQANFVGVQAGDYNLIAYDPTRTTPSCASATPPVCTNSADRADLDAIEWFEQLAARLPSGTGLVTNGKAAGVSGEDTQFLVVVSWDDRSKTGNTGTNNCTLSSNTAIATAMRTDIADNISSTKYCLMINTQF